jgi:hypothetical protein
VENFHLKLENAGNEITIREGNALPPVAPVQVKIYGDIKTVSTYIEKRKSTTQAGLQAINPDRAVVEVSKEKMTICLKLDPESVYGTEVTAKLELSPELEAFNINKNKTYNREELIKLFRFNKIWFDTAEAHDKILKAYQAFNAQVNANVNQSSDTRGNRTNDFNKTVTTNVPEDFILTIPVFKGQEKRRFRVEIALDSTDGSTKFWFESTELHDIITIESELILKEELESCSDYVVIWK